MNGKRKLTQLLSTFQAREWTDLLSWAESPGNNSRPEVLGFLQFLAANSTGASEDPKQCWAAVYKGKSFDRKQFNYLNNWTLELVEDYLIWQQVNKDEGLRRRLLMEAYLDRGLSKHFHFVARKAGREILGEGRRTLEVQRREFQWRHLLERERAMQVERVFSPELQEANDALDAMYLSHKLVYLCEMLDMERFVTGDYHLSMLDAVRHLASSREWADTPLARVYGKLLDLLSGGGADKKGLLAYLERVRQHQDIFSQSEQRSLLFHGINYCIHGINQGDRAFAPLLMTLYREGLESEILLEDGRISPWTFKNMVKLGLGLGEYTWVEHFLTRYSDRLPEKERADALHFNLADLYYHQGMYDKAMDYLMEVTYSDIHYNLGAKVMLLKIYFEKGEEDSFESLLHSFNIFLLRNKQITAEQRKPYRAFVRWLGRLARAEAAQLPVLRQQIEGAKALSDRSWLLQQVVAKAGGKMAV